MYMANVKISSLGPNLYSIGLRWGFALGVMQILYFALRVSQIFEFLDTNMLVYPTRNCGVGVEANVRTQREWCCIAVENRL